MMLLAKPYAAFVARHMFVVTATRLTIGAPSCEASWPRNGAGWFSDGVQQRPLPEATFKENSTVPPNSLTSRYATARMLRRICGFVFASLAAIAGCGGDDPTQAERASLTIEASAEGASPFIHTLPVKVNPVEQVNAFTFTIAPKTGTVSKPVHVTQSVAYLKRLGRFNANTQIIDIPIFGLYAGYDNQVTVEVRYADGSSSSFRRTITTSAYTDHFSTYDRLTILRARTAQDSLGFDFMVLKSNLGGQVVVDTDGNVRWTAGPLPPALSVLFTGEAFLIGSQDSPTMRTAYFDGSVVMGAAQSSNYTQFHHNIDFGKQGYLAEFNAVINGQTHIESVLAEIDGAGNVLREWDFAEIITNHMTAAGDNASAFVRPGADWFHMNAATYDPTDDTIIASSRENFLIKVRYSDKSIVWILGDPTKYWYSFPSLRAKAVTLAAGGLYPIGQHSVSVLKNGDVMIFNNGHPSTQQPAGAPVGESRPYSFANAYRIDASTLIATETWRFDQGQAVSSIVCSSAYQSDDGSALINYSRASNGTKARIVGVDPNRNIVFDFEFPSGPICQTSFNATVVPMDRLELR